MCEDYFLYFEEMDWAFRGKQKEWKLGYCWKSKVYHKEGGSIGSSSIGKRKSVLADFYGLKNKIIFTQRYFPYALPTVYLSFLAVAFNRIRRKQWNRIGMILGIIFSKNYRCKKSL
jgi:GT2 family glycosyltransferase